MHAGNFEYVALLAFLVPLAVSLYADELLRLSRLPSFWLGLVAFILFSTIIESIALYSGWWRFNNDKVVGIYLWTIPIEEYGMFIGFYAMVAAQWSGHGADLE